MHQDKLNTDQFKNNGRDVRTAVALNLDEIRSFFIQKGYKVNSIEQPWRNVVGQLEKDGVQSYFKLGSTPDISQGVKNEAAWNEALSKKLSQNSSFRVPLVRETGEYHELSYMITDFVAGKLISERHQPASQELESWLTRIVDCNLELLTIQIDLPNDGYYVDKETRIARALDTWGKFYEQVAEFELSEVYEKIKLYKAFSELALSHHDFVPWHMIVEGEKFVLIDAESSTSKSPKYYDVVYFFHRVYTSAQSPELAKKYLNMFYSKLDSADKAKFLDYIKPILATRIIGGFWDAKNHGNTDFSLHQQLKQEFLGNNLL